MIPADLAVRRYQYFAYQQNECGMFLCGVAKTCLAASLVRISLFSE